MIWNVCEIEGNMKNTQNLKEYIQQLAQTGIKELTDIVFPPACPVCGVVLGF